MRKAAVERFLEKINKTTIPVISRDLKLTPCWLWTGANREDGYGVFHHTPLQDNSEHCTFVHRYSYEYHKGQIPSGLVIDHLCENKLCVNPDHLEAITDAENLLRRLNQHKPRRQKKDQALPQGIYKNGSGFIVRMMRNGKKKSLGTYKSVEEATTVRDRFLGI